MHSPPTAKVIGLVETAPKTAEGRTVASGAVMQFLVWEITTSCQSIHMAFERCRRAPLGAAMGLASTSLSQWLLLVVLVQRPQVVCTTARQPCP